MKRIIKLMLMMAGARIRVYLDSEEEGGDMSPMPG